MANLRCPCGFEHDLNPQPDDAWLTLPDREEQRLHDEVLRVHSVPRAGEIQFEYGRIYECPNCRRLMWIRPGESRYSVYKPEPRGD